METAKVIYRKGTGHIIQVPKQGSGAMLFLEWLSSRKGTLLGCFSHIKNTDEHLLIRIVLSKEELNQCVEYINSN